MSNRSRRRFLQFATIGAAGAIAGNAHSPEGSPTSSSVINLPFAPLNPRLGMIGTGGRGTELLKNFLGADVQVNALCDIVSEKAENARTLVEKAGQKQPVLYTKGDYAFEGLISREDIDLIVIATPWRWHTTMAVAALKQGKHVAIEVPAATTLEECWKLVDTSEATRRHCIMLENCCYGYNETLILGMVRAGMFGDLLYGEAAYLHDLREELFSNKGEGLWRRTVHTERDGNLYPTHGLGPVANYMGINRGDRFDYLVSMSTPAKGLAEYRSSHVPKDDPKWQERYITGDMNTSLIKTANGLTINLQHDVSNPHPYDRLNAIAGTKGIFRDYPPRIYFDEQPGGEEWGSIDQYKERFEHPLWNREGEIARKLGGHGGMDYLECYRLVECMRQGLPPDMDVYDAASWSAPGPLSQASIASGSAPVKFPDFTRGRWKERKGSTIAGAVA
ncbi:MAG: Gfo/Idh/MocA family oxidoreductase [Acidobacteriaceae bacterium]|nr:Gfo/Idh/MocA family oxidoreductase [Acidobacteriaceae bacterium]MBV9779854.1 Gfo/Idh/MocA family oxidoreductase [Acidobacteriaceae bacterium]